MDTFTYIEYCNNNYILKREIRTARELIKPITDVLISLEQILKSNIEALKMPIIGNQYAYYIYERYQTRTNSANTTYLVTVSINGLSDEKILDDIKHFNNSIMPAWIQRQKEVLSSLNNGILHGHLFIDNIHISMPPYHNSIAQAKTFLGTRCDECGHILSISGLNSHIDSLKCKSATTNRDLREANWGVTQSSTHNMAVKRAGIEYDIRPAVYEMWIPPWVQEAIRNFEQNKKGYAGMALHEYLSKLKAERQ